jgi:hypothetical protein
MARRTDPWTGYEAYRKNEPRFVQLSVGSDGSLHTRWGPVIKQRVEGDTIHMTERSSTNNRIEHFTIPVSELERLQAAADWQQLQMPGPWAYWRPLPEGYATLAHRPDPQGNLRGDYILLTIYQAIHWLPDGSLITTLKEFASGEGNEGAFDEASTWSQQVERGELHPLARLRYVDVELAVGMTVKILDPGLNHLTRQVNGQPRKLIGKEATIVEEWQRGRSYRPAPLTGQWKPDSGHWYVEVEGERLNFSLQGDKEISGSYYVLSELDASGQVIQEKQYHVADRIDLYKRLDHLATEARHGTIHFPSAVDLWAWHPYYRVIDPYEQKEVMLR